MSKNIKDIGKELMGKSLNSFHRKTGLTQLEKNNEMQDGILNGILSQVDDAYIEKIGQSNVIHLEGSGDGVVVLDSIEGNTMVNIMPLANWGNKSSDNGNCAYSQVRLNTLPFKPNTTYTTILLNAEGIVKSHWMHSLSTQGSVQGTIATFTTISDISMATSYLHIYFGGSDNTVTQEQINNIKVVVLEGDWTNKEINYFEGLQSSFEEHKEDDKYKIEILSNSENILNMSFKSVVNATCTNNKGVYTITPKDTTTNQAMVFNTYIPKGTYYYKGIGSSATQFIDINNTIVANCGQRKEYQIVLDRDVYNIIYNWRNTGTTNSFTFDTTTEMVTKNQITNFVPHKQNKIKLLLNSPLLKGDEIVCKEDGLYHYHKMEKELFDGSEDESWVKADTNWWGIPLTNCSFSTSINTICDKLIPVSFDNRNTMNSVYCGSEKLYTRVVANSLSEYKQRLQANPMTVVYELAEPYYEKISNEYGEPIILEGYENGTLYIDSVIVPTTTVRYTPKMESFKTLKEVKIRNTINDFDVANNVIPYMMEVDIKLTELEMSAISTYNIKNIRKMEVLDMISMQERTFKMLERLIRGKSHTKQEMIDRVLLYEQAKRITTEQALELNLIIEEVYGA